MDNTLSFLYDYILEMCFLQNESEGFYVYAGCRGMCVKTTTTTQTNKTSKQTKMIPDIMSAVTESIIPL